MISFITHSQCGSSYVFSLAAAAAAQLLSLSLHDALPISVAGGRRRRIPHQQLLGPVGHGCEGPALRVVCDRRSRLVRSEEHTSELQSRGHLVCRLLPEKKKFSCECNRPSA